MAMIMDIDERWRRTWSVVERESGEAPINSNPCLSPAAMRCVQGVVHDIAATRLLELGSGASTSMLGGMCRDGSRRMDSVDHDPQYFAATQRLLEAAGLAGVVRLHHAPIAPVTDGRYVGLGYRLAPVLERGPFDFVLIDGPPSLSVGRFMTLLTIWPHLTVGAVVVLDDARREPLERRWMTEWRAIFGSALRIGVHDGYAKGLAVLQKRDGGTGSLQSRIAWPHALRAAGWVVRRALHPAGRA
jgi:predicted O-methyltransferase YrrM